MYSIEADDLFLEIKVFLGGKWRFSTLIESDDLFLEITIFWDQNNLKVPPIFLASEPLL